MCAAPCCTKPAWIGITGRSQPRCAGGNHMYQNHHTVGAVPMDGAPRTVERAPAMEDMLVMKDTVPQSCVGSPGAVYQRRAQFCTALATAGFLVLLQTRVCAVVPGTTLPPRAAVGGGQRSGSHRDDGLTPDRTAPSSHRTVAPVSTGDTRPCHVHPSGHKQRQIQQMVPRKPLPASRDYAATAPGSHRHGKHSCGYVWYGNVSHTRPIFFWTGRVCCVCEK